MIASIRMSSVEISTVPMLMPASSGIEYVPYGLPRSDENAAREFANVLTRMPKKATSELPRMPTTENAAITMTLGGGTFSSTAKYTTMTIAIRTQSWKMNFAWVLRYVLQVP